MIVWGGNSAEMSLEPTLGTGGMYDPLSNAWSPVASAGAPTAREFASAVWTGSRMIVWGGLKFNEMAPPSVFNNGGIFDPLTNSWKPVATLGAPSARYGHSAVWTGSEMIVWGGNSKPFLFAGPNGFDGAAPEAVVGDPGPVNDGGIYDPVANAWRAISKLNAPSPRADHTAIWTGNLLIVWGGGNAISNLAGGGIYDPETDTWVRTSSLGEPSARDSHTAVWTGSRMIVWGGFGTMGTVRTGGVFDPDTNAWKPTSTTASPSARALHVAAAYRGHLIVWGGWTGTDEAGTGGIYDPETDSWTTTPISGALSGREEATAVFTGSSMIVWGGYDGSHGLNTGGIYVPPFIACPGRGCVVAVGVPGPAAVGSRP
jgi:N-acetylneuraminic acid mutarotase